MNSSNAKKWIVIGLVLLILSFFPSAGLSYFFDYYNSTLDDYLDFLGFPGSLFLITGLIYLFLLKSDNPWDVLWYIICAAMSYFVVWALMFAVCFIDCPNIIPTSFPYIIFAIFILVIIKSVRTFSRYRQKSTQNTEV